VNNWSHTCQHLSQPLCLSGLLIYLSVMPQVPLYDLRSPLGLAPAALTPLQNSTPAATAGQQASSSGLMPKLLSSFGQLPLPPSLLAARAFASSRAALRSKVARLGQARSGFALCNCLHKTALVMGAGDWVDAPWHGMSDWALTEFWKNM